MGGRPGVIIMEGPEQNMAAFAASLRKLPWKKLRDIGQETNVNHAFSDLEILECGDRDGNREGIKVDAATLPSVCSSRSAGPRLRSKCLAPCNFRSLMLLLR